MRIDYHMHTSFSPDSQASPESMIEAAIQKKLKTICITDHMDKDFFCDGKEFVFDGDEYKKKLQAMQQKYADWIEVLIGVELGLQPHLGEYHKNFLEEYGFDYVIGSVHVANGMDPYYPEFFEGKTDTQA